MTERAVQVRLRDEELLEAFEAAEEEEGSASAAVRAALRETYVDAETKTDGLSDVAQRGFRVIRETVGDENQMVEVPVAESIVANQVNVKKEQIRAAVLDPLRRAGLVSLWHTPTAVFVKVGESSERPVERSTDPLAASAGPTAADERLAEIEAAEVESGD